MLSNKSPMLKMYRKSCFEWASIICVFDLTLHAMTDSLQSMIFCVFSIFLKGNVVKSMGCHISLESTWAAEEKMISDSSKNYWVISAQLSKYTSHAIFCSNFENFIIVNFIRRTKVIHQMKAKKMANPKVLSVWV